MTIHRNSNRLKALVCLSLFAVLLMALSVVIISGCTETLKGDINENLPPVVYFVNIPPDSSNFSYNPVVYWFGSDADGQIDYYRYLVATVEEVGSDNIQAALQWAENAHDTMWTYADIDPKALDPQTAHVIVLKADLDDPVRTYVQQFVFLQAFDDDQTGSDIAVKCLNRNTHPPNTIILNTIKDDTPYVNAATAGGIVTGVKLTWEGTDVRDYDEQGLLPPPFEFEWRLYGPYTEQDTIEMFQVEKLIKTVFVTDDAQMHNVGDTLIVCDSHLVQDDSVYWSVTCTTVVLYDTTKTNTNLGFTMDQYIDIAAGATTWFKDYYSAARSWDGVDTWVWDIADTIYNVYAKDTTVADSTMTRFFIFWVRSRDDAQVADLTPAFAVFPVIEPKYERDILVLDFTAGAAPGYGRIYQPAGKPDSIPKVVFSELISGWAETRQESIDFDTTGLYMDYLSGITYDTRSLPLQRLLKYKVFIVFSDDIVRSKLCGPSNVINHPRVFTAIDAGINCWVTQRALTYSNLISWVEDPVQPVPTDVYRYFGVESIFYSQWYRWFEVGVGNPAVKYRMEDFVGAYSLDVNRWPNIDIDTAFLHSRMNWPESTSVISLGLKFRPDTACVPEVGWCGRRYGTEPMYLYKSKYGPNHFLGYPYTIEGAPVALRYETNLFRTVWLQFTPTYMEQSGMQELTNNILDWLYDPTLGSGTVTAKRYPGAATKIPIDEARQVLEERLLESSE